MRHLCLAISLPTLVANLALAGYVRLLDVDPSATGACPTNLTLAFGVSSTKVCVRSQFPASSLVASASQAMSNNANLKGRRFYTSVNATLKAMQKGSTDAFQTGLRTSSLESSNYVDGLSWERLGVTFGRGQTGKHVASHRSLCSVAEFARMRSLRTCRNFETASRTTMRTVTRGGKTNNDKWVGNCWSTCPLLARPCMQAAVRV